MPIIIDNFHVNVPLPIDNRFVVGSSSFYSTKEDITFKYLGLRVWDLNDNIPYCWAGTVSGWLSENSVGVLADTNSLFAGESGYITKFTSGPNVVGKSLIYENQATRQLGIGLTGININANHSSTPIQNSLHVAGNVKTNNYFVGNGAYITNLNVSNVSSGLLDIRYISNLQSSISGNVITPTNNYVLFNNGVNVTWTNTNTISVLNATNTTNVNVIDETSSTISHYITFAQSTGNLPIKISSSKIQFIPSNGQLLLSNGSVTNPIYSFLNSTNTGMYYNQGISISINGNEITSTRTYGLVLNNRIYIQPTSNNTDVGYGIVWSTAGATNDNSINDGFTYNGQRLNFYGIGSHIPTDSWLSTGRGTYIAGYFGVDTFSGGRLKVKVDEINDVTINSRLNINLTNTNFDTLFNSTNASLVLSTMANRGGSAGNIVVIKDWSVRSALVPNTSTQDSWLTWKHHNGITIDGYYNTPNGPDKPPGSPDSPVYGTLTFWERHPFIHEQYFGSVNRKTLTINSSNPTTQNPFVKVDGNLLVGTNTIIPSAIVDFTSTTKGFLPPRMTNVQKNTITSPVSGLTIYNTDKKSLDTYNGSAWISNIKTLSVPITGWVKDRRQANIPHNLNSIISYDILLQCITTQHGYLPGDITKPSPCYDDEDVTIKYNATSTTFDLLVGNQIRVRNISIGNNINNSEAVTPANWRIIVVFYHYSTINQ